MRYGNDPTQHPLVIRWQRDPGGPHDRPSLGRRWRSWLIDRTKEEHR